MQITLKDKVVWITGASQGIGKATARAFAQAGAHVAIGYLRHKEEAVALADELSSNRAVKVLPVGMDVTDKHACLEGFRRIQAHFTQVDILVNGAGVAADNLFLLLENEDWEKTFATNFWGAVNTTKLVLPTMLENRFGRIINLSSAAAQKGGRGQSNYVASKAALEGFSRSLAVEVGKKNITVNCIAPGIVETQMSAPIIKLAKEEILQRQVIRRFASPEEIAAWVVFLASDYGGFITGQTIHVDGGLKMV